LENAERVDLEIHEIVDEISRIRGVSAVILFGSYSREEFSEGSDIDLLILFDDGESYVKGLPQIFEVTAKGDMFIQAIPMTLDELKSSKLLPTVMSEGRILYSCRTLNLLSLAEDLLKPYALITYDLSHLPPRRKVKFIHAMQGRGRGGYRYPGLLRELDGFKVGRCTMMVPIGNLAKIARQLDTIKAEYVIRYVWSIPTRIEAKNETCSHPRLRGNVA